MVHKPQGSHVCTLDCTYRVHVLYIERTWMSTSMMSPLLLQCQSTCNTHAITSSVSGNILKRNSRRPIERCFFWAWESNDTIQSRGTDHEDSCCWHCKPGACIQCTSVGACYNCINAHHLPKMCLCGHRGRKRDTAAAHWCLTLLRTWSS